MILIDNRELLIPNNERYIGTTQDNNSETRIFRLKRLSQSGVDLSGLTFRLDLRYPSTRTRYSISTSTTHSGGTVVVISHAFLKTYTAAGSYVFTFNGTSWLYGGNAVDLEEKGIIVNFTPASGNTVTVTVATEQVSTDTVLLSKEITDDYIHLTWEITEAQLAVPGTVFAYVRGSDDYGTVRFAGFYGVFYVEENLVQPALYPNTLSELEQLENAVSSGLRKVEYLYTKYIDLSTASENAEAWAVGTRSGVAVGAQDDTYENNAKFFREIAERYAKGTVSGTQVSSGPGYHDNAKYYAEQADISGEKWTSGTVNGVGVGSGDETYHNNAKYYSEQSDAFSDKSEAYAKGAVDGDAVGPGQPGYHDNAKYYAEQADISGEKWTRGTVDGVAVDSEDETYHNNAKYFAEQAEEEKDLAAQYGSGLKAQADRNTSNITNLSNRLSEVAAATSGSEATEIADARVGAARQGSKTYLSLGDALRGQVTNLQDELDAVGAFEEVPIYVWEAGGLDETDGTEESETAIRTGFLSVGSGFIRLKVDSTYTGTLKALFYETADDEDYDDDYTIEIDNTDVEVTLHVPSGYYARLALYHTGASSMDPEEGENAFFWKLVPTVETVNALIAAVQEELENIRVGVDGDTFLSAGAHVRQIEENLAELETNLEDLLGATVPNGLTVDEEDQLWLTANGTKIGEPVDISTAGSGSGGTAGDTIRLTNQTVVGGTTATALTIIQGNSVTLTYTFRIYDVTGELVDGNATVKYYVNNALVSYRTIAQGQNSVTLTSETGGQLASGTNTIIVRVEDADGNHRSLTYTVAVVNLVIASNFNNTSPFIESELTGGAVEFNYTPYGGRSIQKTIHFELDGVEVDTVVTNKSDTTMTYAITRPTHGAHVIRCWMTATVNSVTVTSNVLRYEFMFIRTAGTSVVLSTDFNLTTVVQGNIISIPYLVYSPGALTCYVGYDIQYEAVNSDTGTTYWSTYFTSNRYEVDRTMQSINIRDYPTGTIRIRLYATTTSFSYSGSPTRVFNLLVTASDLDLSIITESLSLNMDSVGRSNEEIESARTVWRSTVGSVQAVFEDFNWITNGWMDDGNGNTPLKVSGGASLTIPFYPFSQNVIGSSGAGMTIEIDFKTDEVSNASAVLLSCMAAGGPGFMITSESITFASDLQEMATQFEPGTRMRVSLVVDSPSGTDRLMHMYVNGVDGSGSGLKTYNLDSMQQGTPLAITASGTGAAIYIYSIRVYSVGFSRRDVVNNLVAGYDTLTERAAAFYANEIYSSGSDLVGFNEVQESNPDLTILYISGRALPTAHVNLDGSVTKVAQTVSGQIIDPDPDRCVSFENQKIEIQGTSSAAYYRKNFKLTIKACETSSGEQLSGYKLRGSSILAQKFCFKADVASSENANNVLLARHYNDTCTFLSPAQQEDENVRQGIDGKPCVIFFACTDPLSADYNNGQPTFIGKYNFNIDKGSDPVFGFTQEDEDGEALWPNAESWEFRNNTSDRCLFRSADFVSVDNNGDPVWLNDFEARYAADEEDATQLAAVMAWVVSTNTDAATGNALAENYVVEDLMPLDVVYDTYVDTSDNDTVKNVTVTDANNHVRKVLVSSRLHTETITVNGDDYLVLPIDESGNELYYHTHDTANYRRSKFYNEFTEHFYLQDALFYYVFTEFFLMVDNRAKNMFLTTYDGTHWMFLPYDFDTALGINNEGELAFGYGLEATDTVGSAYVFNDQRRSVLWNNFMDCFSAEIKNMFAALENAGYLNPTYLINFFKNHQSMWPVSMWNEDADYKYGAPHRDGDDTYLPMWQGDKAAQRSWWLNHRFKYLCSKYLSASALNDRIILRTYTPDSSDPSLQAVPASGNFAITPYQDAYVNVQWGSYTASQRSTAGTVTVLQKPASVGSLNDTETYIYSASTLRKIGDLSPLYVGQCNISAAVHLEELILGSGAEGYENTNCRALTVGNIPNMKKIDLRGLTALVTPIDLSGCPNLEEIYAENTGITAVSLPNGGYIKKLHLPDTIRKLTICNQEYIEEFVCEDMSNVTALRIENCPTLDLHDILEACTSLQFVRLTDVDWEEEDSTVLETLMSCRGIDENDNTTTGAAIVTGSVHVTTIDGDVLTAVRAAFPYLTVTYDSAGVTLRFINATNGDDVTGKIYILDEDTPITCASSSPASPDENDYWYDTTNSKLYKYNGSTWAESSQTIVYGTVTPTNPSVGDWWYDSANSKLYKAAARFNEVLSYGATGHYPYDASHAEIAMPVLKSTAQYDYTFSGWSGSITAVTSSRDITAQYTSAVRNYNVVWKNNDGTTIQTDSNVPYGTAVEWTGTKPSYIGAESGMVFAGWTFVNTDDDGNTTTVEDALRYTVKGATVATAHFVALTVPSSPTAFASCTWGQIIALCKAAYDGTLQSQTGYATLEAYGWSVGDECTITLKGGEEVVLKIWGFGINVDENNHVLPVTIGQKYSLANTRQMNSSAKQIYGYTITGGGSTVVASTMNTTYYNTAGATNVEITFTSRTYLTSVAVTDGAKSHTYYFNGARSTERQADGPLDINYFAQEDCSGFTARAGKVEHTGTKDFSYTNTSGDTGHIIVDGTNGAVKVFDRYLTMTDNNYRAIEFMPGAKLTIPMSANGTVVVTGRALWNGGGFYNSDLRNWLLNTFIDELPAIIQERLVPVKRITQVGGLDWDLYDTYYDKLLIPTYRELEYGSSTTQPYCNENNTPFPTFSSNQMRQIATYRGGEQSAAARVWSASARNNNINYFIAINLDGSINTNHANNSFAVLAGFCVK